MERGLSFALAAKFDFDSAIIYEDKRRDYGETRYFSLGLIGDRLHALVFTTTPTGIRIISLRKANLREVQGYEQFQA